MYLSSGRRETKLGGEIERLFRGGSGKQRIILGKKEKLKGCQM